MNEVIAAGERQRLNQDGIGRGEGCCACANCEPKNDNHNQSESQFLAHHAQRVVGVLKKDVSMLAERRNDEAAVGFPPETHMSERACLPGIAMLIAKDGFHLAREVFTELRGEEAQETLEHSFRERPVHIAAARCHHTPHPTLSPALARAWRGPWRARAAGVLLQLRPRRVPVWSAGSSAAAGRQG